MRLPRLIGLMAVWLAKGWTRTMAIRQWQQHSGGGMHAVVAAGLLLHHLLENRNQSAGILLSALSVLN